MSNETNSDDRSLIQLVLCGPKSSGKTAYLTTLFGRAPSVRTANDETTQLLQADWKRLESGQAWPAATSLGIRELSFVYSDPAFKVRLRINDYDGQLTEILSASTTDSDLAENIELFKDMVRAASGLVFLFPYGEETDGERMRKFRDEINTFLDLIEGGGVRKDASSMPVVLAVNKWDRSPDFGSKDEAAAAQHYLENTPIYQDAYARLKHFLPSLIVVPVSVQRPSEELQPMRPTVEPHNLLAPIRHIVLKVFEEFELQYNRLSRDDSSEAEKARYKLLSAFRNEIRDYRGYANELEQLEARIGERFIAELEQKDPRDIANVMRDEEWFFAAVKSRDVLARIQQTRRAALVSVFMTGLSRAEPGGEAALQLFRTEQSWLFDELADEPQHSARYEAALQRARQKVQSRRTRRVAAVAAIAPLALTGIWTGFSNFEHYSRFARLNEAAGTVNVERLPQECVMAEAFLSAYQGNATIRPPIFDLGANLSQAEAIRAGLRKTAGSQTLSTLDKLNSGAFPSLQMAQQELSAAQALASSCLSQSDVMEGRAPARELADAAERMQPAADFLTDWKSVEGTIGSVGACPNILSLRDRSHAIANFAGDVIAAKARIKTNGDECGRANMCEDFREGLQRLSSYGEFAAAFRSPGPGLNECRASGTLYGGDAGLGAEFSKDRAKLFGRLDMTNLGTLRNLSFMSQADIDARRLLLEDMQSAEQELAGFAGRYERAEDVREAMTRSWQAIYDYEGLGGVAVSYFTFRSGTPSKNFARNPLQMECGAGFFVSSRAKYVRLEFAGNEFRPDGNCEGSGSSSTLTYRGRGFVLPYGTNLVSGDRVGNSEVWMKNYKLNVTRDALYKLRSGYSVTIPVDDTSYEFTFYPN